MYSDFLDWVSCGIKGPSIKPYGFLFSKMLVNGTMELAFWRKLNPRGLRFMHLRKKYIDYFMVGERVRFLFTSCGESQTNERVFERVSL